MIVPTEINEIDCIDSAILELPQFFILQPLHTSSTSSAAPSPVVWFPKVHNSSMVKDDDMMVHGIFVPFLKQQNKVKLTTYSTFQWDFGGSLFHQRLVSRKCYLEPKNPWVLWVETGRVSLNGTRFRLLVEVQYTTICNYSNYRKQLGLWFNSTKTLETSVQLAHMTPTSLQSISTFQGKQILPLLDNCAGTRTSSTV